MSPALTRLQNKLSLVSISWAPPDTDCRHIRRTAKARAPMHFVFAMLFVAIKRWIWRRGGGAVIGAAASAAAAIYFGR